MRVAAAPIDYLIAGVDLVKLDIEGLKLEVLSAVRSWIVETRADVGGRSPSCCPPTPRLPRPTGRGSRLRAVRGSPPSRRPNFAIGCQPWISRISLRHPRRDIAEWAVHLAFCVRLGGIIAAAPRAVAFALPSVLCRWPGRCRVRRSARLSLWVRPPREGRMAGFRVPLTPRHSPSGGR